MAEYVLATLPIILKTAFCHSLGLLAMYTVTRLDYRLLVRFAPAAYLLSVGCSTAVLFFGKEINGSKRWLSLGSFPSALRACQGGGDPFSCLADRKDKAFLDSLWFMCRTMLTLLPIVGLVGSNNLSTAIIILGIGVVLIFVSNPRYLPFVGVGTVGIGVVAVFLAAESYRLERLAIWRNPRPTKKASRPFRGSMPLEAADFLAGGLAAACRSLVCAGSTE